MKLLNKMGLPYGLLVLAPQRSKNILASKASRPSSVFVATLALAQCEAGPIQQRKIGRE
jgi:hypothetical protein